MKSPPPPSPDSFTLRVDAAGAIDAQGTAASPASILLRISGANPHETPISGRAEIVCVGSPEAVDAHPLAKGAHAISRPDSLLIPGLVNAHTHLDLTHIGPMPHDSSRGFQGFVDLVRARRHAEDGAIAQSVREGAAKSLAGGVVAVGDIAGAPAGRPTLAPCQALREVLGLGVSFVEFFALGRGEGPAKERIQQLFHNNRQLFLDAGSGVRLGFQPHAPTTVSRAAFNWLLDLLPPEIPLSTHLAETIEEREFLVHARGPHRDFLESIGLWDDSLLAELGRAPSAAAHLAPILSRRPLLCAHINDASDGDIALLAASRASVAYCPRASAYFGAHERFGPHRYRDMLAAGVNVCLGTDSVINLPAPCDRISTWDEMCFLRKRDGVEGRTLLRLATINAARALGLDPRLFTLEPGPCAGLVAVPVPPVSGSAMDRLDAALESSDPAPLELLYRWK